MKCKGSYRNRIMVLLIMAIFIPLLLLITVIYSDIHDYLINQQNQKTLNNIVSDTKLVDLWFEGKILTLKAIASSLSLDLEGEVDNKEDITNYLKEQRDNSGGDFLNLYLTTEDGRNYNSNNWSYDFIKEDLKGRIWYRGAKENDGLFISDAYEDIMTGHRVITISIPIRNNQGSIIGVLGMDYTVSDIIRQIERINIGDRSFHIVISRENKILFNDSFVKDVDYSSLLKRRGEFLEIEHNGTKLIGVYTKLENINLGILSFEDINNYYLQINKFIQYFIVILTFAVIIALIVVLFVSRQISIPVIELKNGVRRLLAGDFDTQISNHRDDEFGELMTNFNLMAKTIKDNNDNLTTQSKDLFEKNELLQEINAELEASYNQLQATNDQLNYSESKYRTLIENIPDLIWVTDAGGNITYINDFVENVLKYRSEELIGKNISTILCPLHEYQDCSNIVEEFKNSDFEDYDLWFIESDKENKLIISANITRIIDHNDQVIGIQGIGRDVTEKRKLEKQIIFKNQKLKILNEISSSLTLRPNMNTLFNSIVNSIYDLFDTEICSIRLLEDDKLELKASAGNFKEFIHNKAINIYKDISGKAVLDKEIVFLSDVSQTTMYTKKDNLFRHIECLKTLMFIPLVFDNKVTGVLSVGSSEELNEMDIDILKTFSNHAAVTIEKTRLYQNLKDSYFRTIKTLATAVEAKDAYTEGHSLRVSKYSTLIAKSMGLEYEKVEEVNIAGILHDIGKIGIEDSILTKPGKLSQQEYEEITKHPSIGGRILKHIGLSDDILNGVLLHHKRVDLKGYPKDINIEELPLIARIIGVADAFDAMTTNRSYSNARTIEKAMEELILNKGSQFCPEVVQIMENIYKSNKEAIENIIKLDDIDVLKKGEQIS